LLIEKTFIEYFHKEKPSAERVFLFVTSDQKGNENSTKPASIISYSKPGLRRLTLPAAWCYCLTAMAITNCLLKFDGITNAAEPGGRTIPQAGYKK
jgi:hypothetical protein